VLADRLRIVSIRKFPRERLSTGPSTPLQDSPASSDARKTAQQNRSFDSAQDFGSRLGRRENASTLQKTGLNA